MKLWTKCDVMQDRNQWRTVDSVAIHSPFAYHKGEESCDQLRGSDFPKDCVPYLLTYSMEQSPSLEAKTS